MKPWKLIALFLVGVAGNARAQSEPPPVAPAAAVPADAAGDASGSGSGRYDRRLELPSSESYMNDASRLPIAPMIVQPQPTQDRKRPTLWIGGVLVLAAIFLWNRSRRLEHERLEEAASRGARSSKRAVADEDAADLAAAARAGDDASDALDEHPPEYNAAPAAPTTASPAPSDPSQEPR